jgi:quinol monooxygenase YgiN
MGTVHYIVTGTVNDGSESAFRDIAERLVKAVVANEPDAINYDWHISADGTTFAVREQFKDDAAFAAHLGNVGALLGEMVPLVSIGATYVLGDVNADSRAALSGFGGVFLSEFAALNG